MHNPQPHQLSIEFLSWINSELRKEIDRQEALDQNAQSGLVERMKTYLVAGLSSASLFVLNLWI